MLVHLSHALITGRCQAHCLRHLMPPVSGKLLSSRYIKTMIIMLTKAQLFQAEDQTKIVEERLVLITNSRVSLKYYRMTIGSTSAD